MSDEIVVVAPEDVPAVRNAFRLLVTATCLLFVITAGLGVYVLNLAHQDGRTANRTNAALCSLRADLDKRIASSQAVLEIYPQGPVYGIPRSVIQQSLVNSKRTRRALMVLHCEEAP